MPSPFPGMDPYLEDPHYWPGFHQAFITHLCGRVNQALPEGFVAIINERLIVEEERNIYPDVGVREKPVTTHGGGPEREAATAVVDPSWELNAASEQPAEGYIQVVPAKDPTRIITLIELLSPANKARNSTGNEMYLKKQREVLESHTSLLEIDLLRWGVHTVATPFGLVAAKGHFNYLVCLTRSWKPQHWQVWPVLVNQKLPRVWVPLTEDRPEVAIDLQVVMDSVYDLGAFRKVLDYERDPWPALEASDAGWADELLRGRGLRGASKAGG